MSPSDCQNNFIFVVQHAGMKCACDVGNWESEADGSVLVDCDRMDDIHYLEAALLAGVEVIEAMQTCLGNLLSAECKAAVAEAEAQTNVAMCKFMSYFSALQVNEEECLEENFPDGGKVAYMMAGLVTE